MPRIRTPIIKSSVFVFQAEVCLNNKITAAGYISRNGVYLRDMINKRILKGPGINTCGLGFSRTG